MLGPLIIDIAGTTLTDEDRTVLAHPAVGGVVIFSRNFTDSAQIQKLSQEIKKIKSPPLLITVDHEGGRVQRFRNGYTALPSMRHVGQVYQHNPMHGLALAEAIGAVIALELGASGMDLSYTPVLDVDYGRSEVIGDRAFSDNPTVIATLALKLIRGLTRFGFAAIGKHFPGHGFVNADSHLELPIDTRTKTELKTDLQVFENLIATGELKGIMPAHVIYTAVDEQNPASLSHTWMQEILRDEMEFEGGIFSDDLAMAAAAKFGEPDERVQMTLKAGCDFALLCNDRKAVLSVLDSKRVEWTDCSDKIAEFYATPVCEWSELAHLPAYIQAQATILEAVT
jgi:beta-N-acetylhexosaminidase